MNTVKIFVENGTENWTLEVSRVPCAGETIEVERKRYYRVDKVMHTPVTGVGGGVFAEVKVSLIRPSD
jgi:hypothetical protein